MARTRRELPLTTLLDKEDVVRLLHTAGLKGLNGKWEHIRQAGA